MVEEQEVKFVYSIQYKYPELDSLYKYKIFPDNGDLGRI